jgi:hypothetical protein
MSPAAPIRKTALLMGIAVGLLVFAAGVALALAFLPEWRVEGPALDKDAFRGRYRELAARAGLPLEPGEPRVFLTTGISQSWDTFRPRNDAGTDWLVDTKTAVRVEILHAVQATGALPAGNFSVDFSLDGRPQIVMWWRGLNPFDVRSSADHARLAERFIPLVLQPGETLGPRRQDSSLLTPLQLFALSGSSRPEHLMVVSSNIIGAGRQPGALTDAVLAEFEAGASRYLILFFAVALGILAVGGVFLVLALKSRLSIVNGALLALITLATLDPRPTLNFGAWLLSGIMAAALGLWIFLLWSSAESLLRSTDPGFTTSLDALRAGRLGPRSGRALLVGLGFGAALAGLRLGLLSLVEALPGFWPTAPTLLLPFSRPFGSPVANGIALAGGVALALALAFRVLPLRWAPVAAALAAGMCFSPLAVHPFAAQLATGALCAGLLVYVVRRHGLTALLITAVVAGLLPQAVFSVLHRDWMAGGLAAATLPLAAFAVLGWIGLSRSAVAEVQRLSPPGFVRRIEDERRLKHEMDLLARMQRGLLPRTLPSLEGYEIAARSIIANEAGGDLYDVLSDDEGRFWIAAGDVAGHGYSCAIALAMAKAALASSIGRGRLPSEVLQRMDRVLRATGVKRNFTTLALLCLDLESGEAVLSNAGHPYPLLVSGGDVEELAVSGLPLGQGPPRRYEDRSFRLQPGSALVLCSDGLFEAMSAEGSLYGFDSMREVLRVTNSRSASRILEALLADWNHHLRTARPLDDTTVVVLKRTGETAR